MIGTPVETRRATAADVGAISQTLARAFDDDPIAEWCCPPARMRPRVLERFYATRARQVLGDDEVWTESAHAGAALWLPPERWRTTAREDLALMRCLTHPRLIARLPLVAGGLLGVERRHPREPHWYLAMLGTDPAAQGRGIGSALMQPVLDRCDEDGIGAYLESSKEANIAFYARHGFRVTEEHDLPRGPRFWMMWRDPR
jgi:ribosomal protein S18 acetylase RimI-like enzyme